MDLALETIFGPESKFCPCGFEVKNQQPSKRARGEDVEDGERVFFEGVTTEEEKSQKEAKAVACKKRSTNLFKANAQHTKFII